MDSDDEFDDIPDEDWMSLNPATVTSSVVAQPLAHQSANILDKSNSRPMAGQASSGLQTTSASARNQQRLSNVFKKPALPDQESNGFGLDDLPSDAFDSSPERALPPPVRPSQRLSQNLRQATLWGDRLEAGEVVRPSQVSSGRPFRADLPPEVPTHHELNHDALNTWVFPLNLGEPREYQFSIVKHGLFNNTLVALPTGLGKTFIAATVMLNFIRWTKTAKVVFVAPTKPLASQQVQACLSIAGIPRSQATLLTGETPPVLREGEWETKRMFFMTPQTLMNDLSKGYADPKSIVLLVIDEAHRSTGDYAYVKAVEFIRRFSKSFRVLALTATPGSSVEAVQDVIDNLGISHVEIRTEESLDIRQYVHSRSIETVTFDPSDEMMEVRDLFSKALKPLLSKMTSQNIYYGRDPMSLTTFGLLKARQLWMSGPGRDVNQGVKFMMMAVFTILQRLAHSIKLLNFHGIKPFYHSLAEFRSAEEDKKGQGSKLRRQLLDDEHFQKMMSMVEKWIKLETFDGHPKLAYLCQTLVEHFLNAGEDHSTRVIVFSEYRDSAEEIVRILNKKPLLKATVFVGQADSKRSEGMKQKQQIETIEKFKNGVFNVLVATSIGEEGLDIGQVDLIVCYDASASPIRMLQRMGRTGRKRAGQILLLLMKGREEDKFKEAKDTYQKMQEMICDGSRFAFRHDLSSRIVPREIKPEVDKRVVEIPLENSQNPALPEPKKTAAGLRKKPAKKKFNMPDGVETGFTKASLLGHFSKQPAKAPAPAPKPAPAETDFLADLPKLKAVVLSNSQTAELDKLYRDLPFRLSDLEEITAPHLGTQPAAQRKLRRTVDVKHGQHTKRCVKLFKTLGMSQDPLERYTMPYGEKDTGEWAKLSVPSFAEDTGNEEEKDADDITSRTKKRSPSPSWLEGKPEQRARKKRQAPATKPRKTATPKRRVPSFLNSDDESGDDDEEDDETEGEGESTSSPPYRGGARSKPPARGKKGRGGKGGKRAGDDIEEVGDDCTRTSDMEETDGSDDGADLEGFVVDDDMATSSLQRRSTSPTTPCSSSQLTPGDKRRIRRELNRTPSSGGGSIPKEKPFYVPMHFTQTQDSDDDMPDFATMVAKSKTNERTVAVRGQNGTKRATEKKVSTPVSSPVDPDEEDEDVFQRTPVNRKRRRVVLADSDEDG